jgi:hypothetical protein
VTEKVSKENLDAVLTVVSSLGDDDPTVIQSDTPVIQSDTPVIQSDTPVILSEAKDLLTEEE